MAKPGKVFLRNLMRSRIIRFMAGSRESSFRRILLSRILLLSVPVLLAGEYVTYRKARKSMLETARQNLTESAVRKGERIDEAIEALQVNLITAAQATALQSGSQELSQKFIAQLKQQLPTKVECIQLIDLKLNKAVNSTCGERAIASFPNNLWPSKQPESSLNRAIVHVTTPIKSQSLLKTDRAAQIIDNGQLQLILTAPVYNRSGQLSYALSIQSNLYQQQPDKQGSLYGSTVVIDQDGTILEHPIPKQVGRNIQQQTDAKRLESIIKNAIAGQQNFLHVFSFGQKGVESVVGYTAIPSPLYTEPNQKWIILAVASIDNALYGLGEIQQVMFNLIFGLLAANLLATLYLSRDLARPLEKLGAYAVNVQGRGASEPIPKNFQIREFNQLALSLKNMVERLTTWAGEIESAWREAQAANQLKSEFLANTSHELRTPLNAIIGCIRLVKDECCDDREEEMEFLQRADDAAIHLLKIINDILDLSKIEAGTLSVVTEPLDLCALIKEVVDLQMVQIQAKGLQLHWVNPNAAIAIQADPAKLKQVILNVIGNAIKFTDVGSITISTHFKAEPNNNGSDTSWVVLSICDTGIGIPPEQQEKLFRPFVMADGTRTRKYGGTGLGLAISRKLMELMGGTITLHSVGTDKGTTVEISMPLIPSSRSVTHSSEASAKLPQENSASKFAALNGHANHVLSEPDTIDPSQLPRS